MSLNKSSYFLISIFSFLILGNQPAAADLTWAPLVFPIQVYSKLWLLPAALLIEWPFIKSITASTWKQSVKPLIWAGLIGNLGGPFLAGAIGFSLEVALLYMHFEWPGEYWPLYVFSPIIVVPTLATIKLAVLKLLYGKEIVANLRNILMLCVAQILIFAMYITAYHYLPTP